MLFFKGNRSNRSNRRAYMLLNNKYKGSNKN